MRGHVTRPASTVKAAAFLLVVLFLLVPIGSVSAGNLPFADAVDPALPPTDEPVPEDAVPLDDLVTSAIAQVRESGGTTILRPDQFPHYKALEEDEKRLLWQVWQATVAHQRITQPGAVWSAEEDTSRSEVSTTTTDDGAGPARGLRGVWTLDVHGRPQEVLSAGDGAYFLVTSQGILRFEDPNARPSWMVKTGSMQRAETTDVNGDGVPDIVLTMSPWFVREGEPNLIVVDGKTGDQIGQGFTGHERLSTWRLTDVNGDGAMDLVGLTIGGNMVGAKLDGTILWSEPLPRLYQGAGLLLVYAYAYYLAYGWLHFADVDADGTLDIVVAPIAGVTAYAFLVYRSTQLNTHTSWSGADGTELWSMALPIVGDFGYAFPIATGDFDGDGRDDIGYASYSWTSAGTWPVYQSVRHHGFFVTTGEDGTLLADDRQLVTSGSPLFIPVGTERTPYIGIAGFQDLDRDGAAEMITFEMDGYWRGLDDITVVGRGMPTVAGPTAELWRHTIKVEKELDSWGLTVRFRDTDGDGKPELRAHLSGFTTTEEGAIKHTQSTVTVMTAAKNEATQIGVFAFDSDVDPANGQAYAWTQDDRWVRLESAAQPGGLQLIASGSIRFTHDATGDGVPDLLVPKTSGLRWMDGTTGRAALEQERPLNRYASGIVLSEGRPIVIERDWYRSMIWGTDALNGAETWVVDAEAMEEEEEGLWPYAYQDFTGDGRVDLLARVTDYDRHTPERSAVLFTLPDLEEVWRVSYPDGSLQAMDVLDRPGYELVHSDSWYSREDSSLSLYVPGEEAPRWTVKTPDSYLTAAGGDRMVLRNHAEARALEIVDATSGTINLTLPIPEDTGVRGVHLLHVDGDATIDLVWELTKYERGSRGTSYGLVHSLVDGHQIARFETTSSDSYGYGYPVAYDGGDHIMIDYAYGWFYGGGFRAGITDWNQDGHTDLLFVEDERAIVRSGATGEILAVSSDRVRSVFQADLNGDGRNEIGTLSAHGRLRFHAYAEGLEEEAIPSELALRVATPDEPVSEDPSFFAEEKGLLPGVGMMPLIALLVGLLGVLVRRRR